MIEFFTVIGAIAAIVGAIASIMAVIIQWGNPWELTKLEGNYWKLERRHLFPVWIVGETVLPHSSGKRVMFNESPYILMKRHDHLVFQVLPYPTSHGELKLCFYYKLFLPYSEPVYSDSLTQKLLLHDFPRHSPAGAALNLMVRKAFDDREKESDDYVKPTRIQKLKQSLSQKIASFQFRIQSMIIKRCELSLAKEG